MDNTLELLLNMEPKGLPEKDYKHVRLSEVCGGDVIFKLRGIPYNRVCEIRESSKDTNLHIVLAGVVSPDLKSKELQGKFKAATPFELFKNPSFLLPGEVEDIAQEIEKLSGFRVNTLEEVKKN